MASIEDLKNAFEKTAKQDFEAAEELFESGKYPNCIFYAQQAVEKMCKAALAAKGVTTYRHDVLGEFVQYVLLTAGETGEEELRKVVEFLSTIQEQVNRSRYPSLREGKWKSPYEIYGKKETDGILAQARECVSALEKQLRKV